MEYLRNIGAVVPTAEGANIILTDDERQIKPGALCFLIGEKVGMGFISIAPDTSCQAFYQKMLQTYSACINMHTRPLAADTATSGAETTIVAGFARHFSHNVLNALLSAGGFLRQIKAQTDKSEHTYTLWRVVEEKLRFIEELVNGYNDYNHVTSLKMTDDADVATYFHDLVIAISEKTFDKAFSAYLSYQVNNYELSHQLECNSGHVRRANPFFLKLAFCYILKDTIRYLSTDTSFINFRVKTRSQGGRFILELLVENTHIPPEIMDTMFKPWNHQMFAQSFDYWGVVIAQTIITKHGGKMSAENTKADLLYTIEL
jgi:K+-sensing histidine kinase KdpD